MKFLIVFALALSAASAFRVSNSKLGITNGSKVSAGQFLYQVGLLIEEGEKKNFFCGGSLIGKEWVLTAAHCTDGAISVTVYLGSQKRKEAAIKYTVSHTNIIPHPDFARDNMKNDISLIRIPSTSYNSRIRAVKLPFLSSSYSTYVGQKILASGWGLVSDTDRSFPSDLQWARLEVIDNTKCGPKIISSNICVSTPGGVSTCDGDSGGPMVLESGTIQIGVASFVNKSGCTKGYPAVFTRLTNYLDWIKDQTGISY